MNLSQCRMMGFKLFADGLKPLPDCQEATISPKIILDVFPPWHHTPKCSIPENEKTWGFL